MIPHDGVARRRRRFATSLATAGALLLATTFAHAQAPSLGTGISRVDLLRGDLDAPGRETIQARVDFAPGATAANHRHPGEELVYVLKGSLEYRLAGRPPVTLKAGDALLIPAGTPHAVRNVGADSGSELATYILEKGKPPIALVD